MKKASGLLLGFDGEVRRRGGGVVWYRTRKEVMALRDS